VGGVVCAVCAFAGDEKLKTFMFIQRYWFEVLPSSVMQSFGHSRSLGLARLACTFALVFILVPFSGNSLTTPVLTESTYIRHVTFWTQVHSRSTVRLGGRWTAGHVRGWESAWIRMSKLFELHALWVKDDKCRL